MQKRSRSLERRFVPIRLDPEWPILLEENYIQRDEAISYLHIHDCLELGLCHEGQGIFVVGEKILPFSAGDVVFINSTEVHLAQSSPGSRSRWTWVYLDPLRLVDHLEARPWLDPTPLAGAAFRNVFPAREHPPIRRAVQRVIEESQGQERGYAQAIRALVCEAMVMFHRAAPGRQARPTAFHRDYDRLAPALQRMARHYAEDEPIAALARRCSLSEPHFRRLFGRTIGVSPLAYRNDLRVRMAASLLENTSRSVLEISQDVGFESLSSFNRLFRASFRINPLAWRRKVALQAAAGESGEEATYRADC